MREVYLKPEVMSKETRELKHCPRNVENETLGRLEWTRETEENHEAIAAPVAKMETVAVENPGVLSDRELVRGDVL